MKDLQKDPSMHDKLLLFSKFLITPRLTDRESRAICRGAFAPKNEQVTLKWVTTWLSQQVKFFSYDLHGAVSIPPRITKTILVTFKVILWSGQAFPVLAHFTKEFVRKIFIFFIWPVVFLLIFSLDTHKGHSHY